VPEDHATLAEAVAAAADGSTICLAPGTWSEQISLYERQLRIVGAGAPGDTVLDGSGTGRVLKLRDSSLELQGLTIRGGVAELGGGIYASDSQLLLTDVELSDNRAQPDDPGKTGLVSLGGGAIYSTGGRVELVEVGFFDNAMDCGSVAECGGVGGALYVGGDATLWGVQILDTQVRTFTGSYGSAAKLADGAVEVDHLTIAGTGHEGAGYAWAVLSLYRTSSARVHQADIVGNRIAVDQVYAGALSVVNTSLDLQGSHLAFNELIGSESSQGEAIALDWVQSPVLAWNNIHDNGPSPFAGMDDPIGSDGNIDADPLFVDRTASSARSWDLRLDPASPSKDAGDPALLDTDGSRRDIGAFGGR